MKTAYAKTRRQAGFRMTPAQQMRYRLTLWPAAAAALGVDPKDDDQRRDVIERLTGKGNRSTKALTTNNLVTLLFRGLEAIARGGDDVAANMALVQAELEVKHRDLGELADVRGLIENVGFDDAYVERVADPHLRREGQQEWRKLSAEALWKVLYTVRTRRREQLRKDPKVKRPPEVRTTPYHKRDETAVHLAFMRALRSAVPSGALEEITAEAELQLLDGIHGQGVTICFCSTCGARRGGNPGNPTVEKRAAGKADPRGAEPEVETPF